MKRTLPWLVLILATSILVGFFLSQKVQLAGDIAEYYGITESVLNHLGVNLTLKDQFNLEKVLHKAYFSDPGYYIAGLTGNRYPVHFVLYSLIATPIRFFIESVGANPLTALSVTNVLSLFVVVAIIFKRNLVKTPLQKIVLLLLIGFSPLEFFFAWPGPDLWYLSLLLWAVLEYLHERPFFAAFITAVASWHSQPLVVMALGFALFGVYQELDIKHRRKTHYLTLPFQSLLYVGGILGVAFIPYVYNLYAFGVLTPWTIFQDGWTILNGFGLKNMSLWKLYEQIFDLNIGVFWYMPLGLAAIAGMTLWAVKNKSTLLQGLLFITLITAFFYQTNPAWHYGTAGFGPSRHVIFLVPIFIALLSFYARKNVKQYLFLIALSISQFFILSQNGYFLPNFENTLKHNWIATYVLDQYPRWYNPTPEIFVDRTNHTDITYPTSAMYTYQGRCTKAYVIITDIKKVESECGPLAETDKQKLDNEFLRQTNYARQVWALDATFWPDSNSCEDWFYQTPERPYQCMKTAEEVARFTGVTDITRIKPISNIIGVWRIDTGVPVKLTVPPGYIIHHTSFSGAYITF